MEVPWVALEVMQWRLCVTSLLVEEATVLAMLGGMEVAVALEVEELLSFRSN